MMFGSRATGLISRMGPFGRRALKAADVLPVGGAPLTTSAGEGLSMTLPAGGSRLRVVMGHAIGCSLERRGRRS